MEYNVDTHKNESHLSSMERQYVIQDIIAANDQINVIVDDVMQDIDNIDSVISNKLTYKTQESQIMKSATAQ